MTGLAKISLLNDTVRLYQPEAGFKVSTDALLLAAACPVTGKARVLDMGCGIGGATFCLLARCQEVEITGVDLQQNYIDNANKNKALNINTGRCEFIQNDIRDYEIKDQGQRFDHIICNPPYFEAGHYTPSPNKTKAVARGNFEESLTIEDWLMAGARLLKPQGTLTLVHKADKLSRIVTVLSDKFGSIQVIPLWPKAGREAKRVIIRATRGSKGVTRLSSGLILHEDNGDWTAAARTIIKDGVALTV